MAKASGAGGGGGRGWQLCGEIEREVCAQLRSSQWLLA
eukprot:SAG31_NODE_28844_length_404_cov_1.055738_1_plen_37_part_10